MTQYAVGSPFLRQLNNGAWQVSIELFQLSLKSRE